MRNIFKLFSGRERDTDIGGIVEVDALKITGWVAPQVGEAAPSVVDLYLNDTLASQTPLVRDATGQIRFEIGMYDVWRFVRPTDKISVKYGRHSLPTPGGGSFIVPRRHGKEDLAKLRERFAVGQFFDERGRIRTLKNSTLDKDQDHVWQDGVMNLYQDVDEVIREVAGTRSFIFSGTLLGYVRDQGFIPHDKDMDCAYLSGKQSAAEVAAEFAGLADALIAAGFSVTPKASCIAVRRRAGSFIMVDIAHLFVKQDGCVGFPFGRVGLDDVHIDAILPIGSGDLGGYPVGLPANPGQVVEHVYGKDWRIPDPGFNWRERRRSRDPQPLLDYSQRARIAMDDYYSRPETTEPSAFVQWLAVSGKLPELAVAYDLGCGNGRDLPVLASVAESAIGLERSRYAVAAATDHVDSRSDITVRQIDVLHPGSLKKIVAENRVSGSRLFYMRFLLNGLTDQEQLQLLEELHGVLRAGDVVAFEHRTSEDSDFKKARFRSFRRFINTEELSRQLLQIDLKIVHCEEGIGLAAFERENPHVVRLIAKIPE